jgi:hypothetical protein
VVAVGCSAEQAALQDENLNSAMRSLCSSFFLKKTKSAAEDVEEEEEAVTGVDRVRVPGAGALGVGREEGGGGSEAVDLTAVDEAEHGDVRWNSRNLRRKSTSGGTGSCRRARRVLGSRCR